MPNFFPGPLPPAVPFPLLFPIPVPIVNPCNRPVSGSVFPNAVLTDSVRAPVRPSSPFWTLSYEEINSVNTSQEIFNSFCKLPIAIRVWILFEQKYNSKINDPDFSPPVINYSMDQQFIPDNRNVFELDAYRIPNSYLQALSLPNCPLIHTLKDGPDAHILLVHPTMRQHGNYTVPGASTTRRRFFFTPFASPRTGVTWEFGKEDAPFILKMSIAGPQWVGGQRAKTDLGMEGPMSVHKSGIVLERLTQFGSTSGLEILPETSFMCLSAGQGQPNFGVLFRPIPSSICQNRNLYVPFFSLAFTPTNGTTPLLVQCIQKSRLSTLQFLMNYIYLPVVRFIFNRAQQNLYAVSLHGQNLLCGLNIDFSHSAEVRVLGLSESVLYRDVADIKIPNEILTDALRQIREQTGGRPIGISNGSYIYQASQHFVNFSLYPIVTALQYWKRCGLIQIDQQVQPDDYMFGFYAILVKFLLIQLNITLRAKRLSEYADILRSIEECREFAVQEDALYRGTKRSRNWLTQAADLLSKKATDDRPQITIGISPQRPQYMQEYLTRYLADLKEKAQALDRMSFQQMS